MRPPFFPVGSISYFFYLYDYTCYSAIDVSFCLVPRFLIILYMYVSAKSRLAYFFGVCLFICLTVSKAGGIKGEEGEQEALERKRKGGDFFFLKDREKKGREREMGEIALWGEM